MDSYIVRIYRRDRTRQKELVGIVEKVGAARGEPAEGTRSTGLALPG